ncbi:MAG: sugar transferase EpsL [Candidatus Marinamargulisbacteria bacterium]|jgi:sugar transferase EpsL
MKFYYYLKCLFDFVGAAVLLVLAIPLFFLIGLGILITMGRPILFIQNRGGFHNKIFKIYKFRTMKLPSQVAVGAKEKVRLTRFGNWIRVLSLDELPQLLNILLGNMSFIGPRPLLAEYLHDYSKFQKIRHSVKPGITGWAQVNGRNSLTWKQRFKLDFWYVKNYSVWLDTYILFRTFVVVLNRVGLYTPDGEIMPNFKGKIKEKEA